MGIKRKINHQQYGGESKLYDIITVVGLSLIRGWKENINTNEYWRVGSTRMGVRKIRSTRKSVGNKYGRVEI